jgi:hypothetical protein
MISRNRETGWLSRAAPLTLAGALLALSAPAQAKNPYRQTFFDAYPQALDTRLDDVASNNKHCGVCHWDFDGGGARNPYGQAVEGTGITVPEILALGSLDSDGDGFDNETEILDPGALYDNTPTFPGLTAGNIGQTTNVDLVDIQDYVTPEVVGDTEPPVVTVTAPNGGETLPSSDPYNITWTATDNSGTIAAINIYASFDGGVSYRTIARGLSNTGSYNWFTHNRPTTEALIRIEARDAADNFGSDTSDAGFTIVSSADAIVPTTLRDFDMPGTQPLDVPQLEDPDTCRPCHGDYAPEHEPYFNWMGSMMAHASIDPLYEAAQSIANQDAAESGDLCLRCHIPAGWLGGRSTPTDGTQMLASDKHGVSCTLCHNMVDPHYEPGVSPPEDQAVLDALAEIPNEFANGMYVVDGSFIRRGPYDDADLAHAIIPSPFHREAAFCGTCHDVSNTALENDGAGNYVANTLDAPATDFASSVLAPVERTYSEWLNSEYNTQQGVFAPQFGGNKQYVSTCQDCHMRDVTGEGCNDNQAPTRTDLALHDMTGGSAWMLENLRDIDPNLEQAALDAGAAKARYMLQNAALLEAMQEGGELYVTVTNNTGHKLPTGYPEGRRIWLNVQFYDATDVLVAEFGAYDAGTGVLTADDTKVYEALMGLDDYMEGLTGIPAGKSFHFVLSNDVIKDNRIPARGFTNAAYEAFGGAPVEYSYANGQYWDETAYTIPQTAASAVVTLYYQSTSKEYVEFLQQQNTTDGKGDAMYAYWNDNGKCPPELMRTVTVPVTPPPPPDCPGDLNGDLLVDQADLGILLGDWGCTGGDCPGDIDGDGDTDQADLGALLANYGVDCN